MDMHRRLNELGARKYSGTNIPWSSLPPPPPESHLAEPLVTGTPFESAAPYSASASFVSVVDCIMTCGAPNMEKEPDRYLSVCTRKASLCKGLCGDITTSVWGSPCFISPARSIIASVLFFTFFTSGPPISGTRIGGCGTTQHIFRYSMSNTSPVDYVCFPFTILTAEAWLSLIHISEPTRLGL